MSQALQCPDTAQLERFLLGQDAGLNLQGLEAHLERCPSCAVTLSTLRAEDGLVRAVRAAREQDPTPHQDLLGVLLPLLKCLRPAEAATTSTTSLPGTPTATAPANRSAGFSFLAPPEQASEIGRLGPYRLVALLGSGGMGMVFRAHDARLKREIALKVIKPELMSRGDVCRRFLREAQAVAAVEHDNIVSIYQAAEEHGVPFLAMPLLRGESLEQRLARTGGALPIDEILAIGRQTAAGLAAAHQRGLIHRDVKPANLWLETRPAPRVKILDFGLAAALQGDETDPGHAEAIVGTPAYMAPEQAQGKAVDHRADLFSLGCVLYRLATGRPAFEGSSHLAVLVQVATFQPVPPRQLNPSVPAALDALIVRLLAKHAADRPASAQAVVEAIAAIEHRRQAARRPWLTRRGWLLATMAGLLGGAGLWQGLARLTAPRPAAVTLQFEESDPRLILVRDGQERAIDVRATSTLALPPGEYHVRPVVCPEGRRLFPDHLTVEAGAAQTIQLTLVGEIAELTGHTQSVWDVALAAVPDGLLVLSAGNDRKVAVWKPAAAQDLKALNHREPVRAVAVAADGKRAASAGGGKNLGADLGIHLWDLDGLRPLGEPLEGHESLVAALAWSPDGALLLSGAADGGILLWDLATRRGRRLEGHNGLGVRALTFDGTSRQALSAGGDGRIILWDLAEGKPVRQLNAHKEGVRAVAFVAGGPDFASVAEDGSVHVWDGKTFTPRALFVSVDPVLCLAVSPDATRLLGGTANGKLVLWDMAGGRLVLTLEGHQGPVHRVVLTPDGRQAVSAGRDGTVRLWQLPR